MEYSIKCGLDGRIGKINYKPGEFVSKNSVLVELEKMNWDELLCSIYDHESGFGFIKLANLN